MKTLKITTVMLITLCFSNTSFSQNSDSLGVIGDNLNLYAVLDAFKDAENVQAFEKTLNDPESKINNLDLDEDGNVDYIQVIDNVEDDAHALILRIELDATESQDIAVIELEKTEDNTAIIQLVGDEEIYGKDYIVEPNQDVKITERMMLFKPTIYNVWGWRSVRHIYGPSYTIWVSPWGYNNHPKHWKPWRQHTWRVYNGHHRNRHKNYHVTRVHHANKAHGIFGKHRRTTHRIRSHKGHHANKGHGGGHNSGYNNNGHKGGNNNGHGGGHKGGNHKTNNGGSHKTNKGNGHKPNNGGGSHKTNKGGGHKGGGGGHKTKKH
jgi:hypothetical protein